MSGLSRAILPRDFASDAIPRRVGSALKRRWLAYMDWRLQRLTIGRLRGMSDRELKDFGLCRAQIEFEAGRQAQPHPMLDGRFC